MCDKACWLFVASLWPSVRFAEGPCHKVLLQGNSRYDFVIASRPSKVQPTAGALRTETVASHVMHGVTFGAPNGDLTLSWMSRLSHALANLIPRPDRPSAIIVKESATHLVLQNAALAYTPARDPDAGMTKLGTALVATMRGLHTSTAGSVRFVDVCDLKVALGEVRLGAAAPWGCATPSSGWTASMCKDLGLHVVLAEQTLFAELAPAAAVDSEMCRTRCAVIPSQKSSDPGSRAYSGEGCSKGARARVGQQDILPGSKCVEQPGGSGHGRVASVQASTACRHAQASVPALINSLCASSGSDRRGGHGSVLPASLELQCKLRPDEVRCTRDGGLCRQTRTQGTRSGQLDKLQFKRPSATARQTGSPPRLCIPGNGDKLLDYVRQRQASQHGDDSEDTSACPAPMDLSRSIAPSAWATALHSQTQAPVLALSNKPCDSDAEPVSACSKSGTCTEPRLHCTDGNHHQRASSRLTGESNSQATPVGCSMATTQHSNVVQEACESGACSLLMSRACCAPHDKASTWTRAPRGSATACKSMRELTGSAKEHSAIHATDEPAFRIQAAGRGAVQPQVSSATDEVPCELSIVACGRASDQGSECHPCASPLEQSMYCSMVTPALDVLNTQHLAGPCGPGVGDSGGLVDTSPTSSSHSLCGYLGDGCSADGAAGADGGLSPGESGSEGSVSADALLAATLYQDTMGADGTPAELLSLQSSSGFDLDAHHSWIPAAEPLPAIAARSTAEYPLASLMTSLAPTYSGSSTRTTDAELLTREEVASMRLVRVHFSSTTILLWPEAVHLARQFCLQAMEALPVNDTKALANGASSCPHDAPVSAHASELHSMGAGGVCLKGCAPEDTSIKAASSRNGSREHGDEVSSRHAECSVNGEKLCSKCAQLSHHDCGGMQGADPKQAIAKQAVCLLPAAQPPSSCQTEDSAEWFEVMHSKMEESTGKTVNASGCLGRSQDTMLRSQCAEQHAFFDAKSITESALLPLTTSCRDCATGMRSGITYMPVGTRSADVMESYYESALSTRTSLAYSGGGNLGHDSTVHDAWAVEQATTSQAMQTGDICSDWTTVAQAASIPTDQERDGNVDADVEGREGGLLSAVDTSYVAAGPPTPTGNTHAPLGDCSKHALEAIVGRLSSKYPDSAARLTVHTDSLVITLSAAAPGSQSQGDAERLRMTLCKFQAQHDLFQPGTSCHQRFGVTVHRLAAHQSGFHKASAAARRGRQTSRWRALASWLHQGPQDPRKDMLRVLLRLDDSPDGTRHACASLRLPSLRLRLSQPIVAFLQVRCLNSYPLRAGSQCMDRRVF
jgi:hypothetical protein